MKLQEELRLQAEAHAKHTNELTERLGTKEGQAISTDEPTKQLEVKELELEKLRGEMKTLSHASKTVKGIIAHVRSTDVYNFLSTITSLASSLGFGRVCYPTYVSRLFEIAAGAA